MRVASYRDVHTARARAAFREWYGLEAETIRAALIASLTTTVWRGRTLYQLRCHGISGRGPHDQYVPEALLWALIDFRGWYCPYHTGDAWKREGRDG